MKFRKFILAGALLSPLAFTTFFAQPAEAGDYCREYQKTIQVGGHWESGYGTACQQPDGSWMIVSTEGTVDPFDELRRNRDVVIVSQQQPVYYDYGPTFRPVTYYPRVYSRPYYPRSGIYFSFSDNDRRYDNGWHRGWDRHDRHDRNDHDRGRHRGRD